MTSQPDPGADPADLLQRFLLGQPSQGVRLREEGGRTWLAVYNEFARVEVTVETGGNGPLLVVRDPEIGNEVALDPLELEALTRVRHREFGPLILDRWPDADPPPTPVRDEGTDGPRS